ncbi:hypothetical protein [Mucilaginibacter sp.]|uniref:hypothetical protein n=1 Tax=Mucilaginibacter sp. TaxID=1882438 RepID=UPI0025E6FBA2|nr:hypothetical protein [Mucilaginibacter sp.]
MLTFDEFFKKKRVDLVALEKTEPALFSEFKTHYEQMGEKSFDHTKKYWFNKTRRQYPLAPEVKTEKPQIANPIAEQTITESLTEHTPPVSSSRKVGFTPKFRAANVAKPAVGDAKEEVPATPNEPAAESVENAPAKPAGFVPRFKMKPKAESEDSTPAPVEQLPGEPAAKPAGFTPRFKMKPKAEAEESAPATFEQSPAEPAAVKPAGFVPRFKMKPKSESVESAPPVADEKPLVPPPRTDRKETGL